MNVIGMVCPRSGEFFAILERLDQALLEVIDNPQKTQKTAAIGMLF